MIPIKLLDRMRQAEASKQELTNRLLEAESRRRALFERLETDYLSRNSEDGPTGPRSGRRPLIRIQYLLRR